MTTARRYFQAAILALMAILTCTAALFIGRDNEAHAAVSLLYFRGRHNGDSVLLQWATATELNTAYFYIERADQQNGPFQMLDQIGLVPSEAPPDGLSGAEYQRVDDDDVSAGQAFWYVLVEVESGQGSENRTQPVRVAFEETQATATASRTATPTPSSTPTTVAAGSTSSTPMATAVGSTTTPGTVSAASSGRSVSLRSTATPLTDESAQLTSVPQAIADGQSGIAAQEGTGERAPDNGYPPPIAETPVIESDSAQSAYPDAPPTPRTFATSGYPMPVSPRGLGDGTPVPSIGANDLASNTDPNEGDQESTNSPALGTLFLWIGFAAALVVFVSAVAGAIYYYSRQRSGTG